ATSSLVHVHSCVGSCFFFSSRRRHTRLVSDWSSDVCSSDLDVVDLEAQPLPVARFRTARSEAGGGIALRTTAGDPQSIDIVFLEIGRASCRERVEISVGAGSVKKKR